MYSIRGIISIAAAKGKFCKAMNACNDYSSIHIICGISHQMPQQNANKKSLSIILTKNRLRSLLRQGQIRETVKFGFHSRAIGKWYKHFRTIYMILQSYGIKSFLVDRARRDINRNRDELRRVEGDIRKEENQRLRLKDDLASAKRHLDKVLQEIRSLEMSSRNYQDFGRKHFTNIYGLTQTEFFSELLCDMDGRCGKVGTGRLGMYGRI